MLRFLSILTLNSMKSANCDIAVMEETVNGAYQEWTIFVSVQEVTCLSWRGR